MNPEHRKHLAISASMEGKCVVLNRIGKKMKVSEMELICLCTFAEIGMMSLFSEIDGQVGIDAAEDLEKTLSAVRRAFARQDGSDGLNHLATSTAALLRGPRFNKYIPR